MTKSASSQKPASPKPHPAIAISSDKNSGEYLWMKRNKKLDHQRNPSEKNTLNSLPDGNTIQSTEQSATVARGIVGNDHVSISPWTDCSADDPNKARALATSTGVPEIRASQKSDEASDNMKEGNSLKPDIKCIESPSGDGVAMAKVEQQTGEQRKMRQGGVGALNEFGKVPAGLVLETQNSGPGDTKTHAHSVDTSYSRELDSGDTILYFDPAKFPVDCGTEGGININSILADINEQKTNKQEDALDTDRLSPAEGDQASHIGNAEVCLPLNDVATKMSEDGQHRLSNCWAEEAPSSADTTQADIAGSNNKGYLLENELKCGSRVQHPTGRAGKNITVTTSIKQVVTRNTGAAENSKIQTEINAISPNNAGSTNTASCLTPMFSGDNRATSIPSKAQIGIAQLRPLSINANNADKMELPEPYSLFDADRDDLLQHNTSPTVRGSEDIPSSCNIGQLSIHGLDTSLSNLPDQNKYHGGTDVNRCLPPISKYVSRRDKEETTPNDNNTQSETGGSSSTAVKISSCSTPPLSAVGAPVSKIYTLSSAETDVQVELAVNVKEPCDDSEAEDVAHICGSDPDFDLNCGTSRITKEDFVELGLHNLSWVKLSDATMGPPSMSTEDLRGNASKDSPFLVGDANAGDGSDDENLKANKNGNDISDSKLPVANADSLRSMELLPPIDCSGACDSQDSPGDEDAVPGSSSDCPPTTARVEPYNGSPRTPNVTDPGSADGSVWVKVEIDTNDIPTQMDIVEGE